MPSNNIKSCNSSLLCKLWTRKSQVLQLLGYVNLAVAILASNIQFYLQTVFARTEREIREILVEEEGERDDGCPHPPPPPGPPAAPPAGPKRSPAGRPECPRRCRQRNRGRNPVSIKVTV